MSQLFRPHSNLIAKLSLVGILGLVVGTSVIAEVWKISSYSTEVGTPYEQRVPFSHKHHVGAYGIDCRYCHTGVEKSSFAGLPATETCMSCHSQIWTNSPLLAPVRESFASKRPLHWERVHKLPRYVYFDHSIHVNKGVSCVACHGHVDEMPLVAKQRSFQMRDCLGCHRDPERWLTQREKVFDPDWKPAPDQLELGKKLVADYHIRKNHIIQCSACHR